MRSTNRIRSKLQSPEQNLDTILPCLSQTMLYWTLLYCILHYCTLHCINIANYNLLQCIYVCHYLDLFLSDNQGLHYFSMVTKILPSGVFPITGFRYFSNHQMDNRFKLIPRLKSYYAYAIIMDNPINYLSVQS